MSRTAVVSQRRTRALPKALTANDHAISRQTRGVSGYAPIGSGQQILTGVLGDASFYIEQPAFDRYVIVWATDGEYDDEADTSC